MAMQPPTDEISHGGISKIERYGWIISDLPGEQMSVDKRILYVDDEYQRTARQKKILSIASKWSWVACGVIIAARRDGRYYVIDGQHRVLAALKRKDIIKLPCIVFNTEGVIEEAVGFLASNTLRKPLTSVEKFKAMVISEHPAALIVDRLLTDHGLQAGSSSSPKVVKCVGILIRTAERNLSELEAIWPIIVELSDGRQIRDKLIEGLIYIERFMPEGESLTNAKWKARVKSVGAARLLDGAMSAAAYFARGGANVWAEGMVRKINYRCKNKLKLTDT